MKSFIITAISSLIVITSQAQQFLEVGGILGFSNYQGDLVEDPIKFGETRLSYGGFLRYHLKDRIKIKGGAYLANISGSDENADGGLQSRGWKFEASVLEFSLQGEYHPLAKPRTGETGLFQKQVSPYIATGFGVTIADVKLTVPAQDVSKFPEPGETNIFLSIPIVAGVRVDLHEHFSLGFEAGWRTPLSDYLDGVSKNGNPDKNDWYIVIGGTASYFFGSLLASGFETN
jgi:hypothetical protein